MGWLKEKLPNDTDFQLHLFPVQPCDTEFETERVMQNCSARSSHSHFPAQIIYIYGPKESSYIHIYILSCICVKIQIQVNEITMVYGEGRELLMK